MAIKIGGTYMGGEMYLPRATREDVERFQAEGYLMRTDHGSLHIIGPPLTDIRPSDLKLDCKYCYTDDAPTVLSWEAIELFGPEVQVLCANCGAGLTPCEPTLAESLAAIGIESTE